jgi:hypothetical protein
MEALEGPLSPAFIVGFPRTGTAVHEKRSQRVCRGSELFWNGSRLPEQQPP